MDMGLETMELGETMEMDETLSELCRICLDSNCKLYSMKMYELDQTFEVISGIKLYEDQTLPVKACAICILLLKKCKLLSHDIHRAQEVLQHFIQKDDELNSKHLYLKLPLNKSLKHNLTRHPFPPNHFDFIYEHTEIKLIEINESQPEKDIHNEMKDELNILVIKDENIEEYILDESLLSEDIYFDSEISNQEGILFEVDSKPTYKLIKTKEKKKLKKKPTLRKSLNSKSKEVNPKIDRRSKPTMNKTCFTLIPLSFKEQLLEMYKRKECSNYINAVYKCEECFRGYQNAEAYHWHTKNHSVESGSHVCEVCNFHFRARYALNSHVTLYHSTRYRCDLCPFASSSRAKAGRHEKWHNGTKYECTYCPKVFEQCSGYHNHLRLKHPSDFVCQVCGYSFVTERGLHLHKKGKHRNVSMDIPENAPSCELCGLQFVSVEAFEKHLRVSYKHQENKDRKLPNRIGSKTRKMQNKDRPAERKKFEGPINCEQCGMQMENPREYSDHFRKTHPDKNRTNYPSMKTPYMCEICGSIYPSYADLQYHNRVHTGEKPFKCDVCSKSFRLNQRLASHKKIHSTQRTTYECNLCGKLFLKSSNRTRHMLIHTLKPFQCEMCSKSFKQVSEKRLHIKQVHQKKPRPKCSKKKQRVDTSETVHIELVEEGLVDFKGKDLTISEQIAELQSRASSSNYMNATYKCKLCYKGYMTEDTYNSHLAKHGEISGQYDCIVCHRRFKTVFNLKRHMTKHAHRYTCLKCEFSTCKRGEAAAHSCEVEVKYACDLCTSIFGSMSLLMTHCHEFHSSILCDVCGVAFIGVKEINHHKRLKHPEQGT